MNGPELATDASGHSLWPRNGGVVCESPGVPEIARKVVRKLRSTYRDFLADGVDTAFALGDDPSFAEWYDRVWPVLQWDHRPSARRLFELAARGPGEGAIVEIGSFIGNSTVFLAAPWRDRVHAVDPHSDASMTQVPGTATTSQEFIANLERFGVRERVVYHREASVAAAHSWSDGSVRLLFIDGLHTYDAVTADYRAWAPHLARRHVVLFDDFLWGEVERAVRDLQREATPPWFAVRGGQAMFATEPLPLRMAGLP
jgi:predicted O-methyltransferase YrrM